MSTINEDKFYEQQQEDWAARDAEVTRRLNEEYANANTTTNTTTNTMLTNRTSNTTISMTDYGLNCADNVIVLGTAGNDIFGNDGEGEHVTISGGAGNDSINNQANYVSISGGAGNDSIRSQADYVSISGGTGNDKLSLYNYTGGIIVQYANGDGNDTVYGWSSIDTLYVEGSYTTQNSDDNVIVKVGDGSIIFRGYSDALKIETASTNTNNVGNSNLDSLRANAQSMTESLRANQDLTETTGTNQVISSYVGQPLTVNGNFMGASFSGNNFVVNSSAGTLTIQNVTDKIVDLRNSSGGEFIKAYQASTAGVIDGRGIASYEIIYGSSAGMDVILAGDGGSQLWGGSGNSADAIAGGNGTDIFIGGRYQGSDVFYNASSADVVSLTDASLSDIVAAVEVNGNIAIGFNTGNIVTIQSTDTLSAAINLADGSSWRFNHSTKSWQAS
ncbi:MAG: hypothetical protein IJ685_01390 [Selenomonadaceae bacterium]|nr:hypothetical protein [Selenomonadaceae bacterium]